MGGPHQDARQDAGQRGQRGLGGDPAAEAHGNRQEDRQQRVVRADLVAVRPDHGLHRKSGLVERPVALGGQLVVDGQVAVLGQAEGGQ
jgi:hypothetical protein